MRAFQMSSQHRNSEMLNDIFHKNFNVIDILATIKFHDYFKDFPNIEYSRMKEQVLYRFRYQDGMPFISISFVLLHAEQ